MALSGDELSRDLTSKSRGGATDHAPRDSGVRPLDGRPSAEVARLLGALVAELCQLRKQHQPHRYHPAVEWIRRWGWLLGGLAAAAGTALTYSSLEESRRQFRIAQNKAQEQLEESRRQFRVAQDKANEQFSETLEAANEDLKLTRVQFTASQLHYEATRRATLLAVLYDHTECGRARCPPKSSARARAEAVRSLKTLGVDDFARANLSRAKLTGSKLHGADFQGADLREADLRGAELTLGSFVGAKLIGTDLRNADLRGVDFRKANVIGADFDGADLRRANLSGALNVTQEQMKRAAGDSSTGLPKHLERPKHWVEEEKSLSPSIP